MNDNNADKILAKYLLTLEEHILNIEKRLDILEDNRKYSPEEEDYNEHVDYFG